MSASFCTIVRLDVGTLTALQQHSFLLFIRFFDMTTAFVTRCPYCGAVWRLPDRDTAERGPVRCSACQHSFDATCHLLEVPQDRFPDLPPTPVFAVESEKPAPTPAAEPVAVEMKSTPAVQQKPTDPTPSELPSAILVNEQSQEKPAAAKPSEKPAEEPDAVVPAAAPAGTQAPQVEPSVTVAESQTQAAPLKNETPAASDQLLRLHGMTPGEELQVSKPNASLARIIPAKNKPQATQAHKIRVAETLTDPAPRPRARTGAFASVFTAFLLLMILAAALAVIFNQKIIAAFPQTTSIFHNVCGKVPCPGFFLSDISAFVVSKTNLRALDESGNYQLEITLINGSDMPQAIPSLDIELVDDADTTLMHKTLTPAEYLSNPPPASLAADRSITVRFSMQTNVTPARCIVTPVYAK